MFGKVIETGQKFYMYNVCFCEAFDGLIHVCYGDRNWSKILMD